MFMISSGLKIPAPCTYLQTFFFFFFVHDAIPMVILLIHLKCLSSTSHYNDTFTEFVRPETKENDSLASHCIYASSLQQGNTFSLHLNVYNAYFFLVRIVCLILTYCEFPQCKMNKSLKSKSKSISKMPAKQPSPGNKLSRNVRKVRPVFNYISCLFITQILLNL